MLLFLHFVVIILDISSYIIFFALLIVPIYWLISMGQKQSRFRPLHIFLFGIFLFFLFGFVIEMIEFASDREEEIISNHKYSIVKNFYESEFKCRAIYLEEKFSDNQLIELSRKIKNKRYKYEEQVTIEYWTDKKAAKDRQAKDKLKAIYTYNSKEKISNLIVYKGKTEKKYQVKLEKKQFSANNYYAELEVFEKFLSESAVFRSTVSNTKLGTYELFVNEDIWSYVPGHKKEEILYSIYLAYSKILERSDFEGNACLNVYGQGSRAVVAKVDSTIGVKIYK